MGGAKVKYAKSYEAIKELLYGSKIDANGGGVSERTQLINDDTKKSRGVLTDMMAANYGDVGLLLALSNLIYVIASLRDHAQSTNYKVVLDEEEADLRKKIKAAPEGDKHDLNDRKSDLEKKKQLVLGDYSYTGGKSTGSPEEYPRFPLKLKVLEEILMHEEFAECEQTELTVRCMKMLKTLAGEGSPFLAFINNFDAAHNELELVYGITALIPHPDKKSTKYESSKISVVFRGSTTLNDWLHNAHFLPAKLHIRTWVVKRGVKEIKKACIVEGTTNAAIFISADLAEKLQLACPDGIKVHSGYLKYLFAKQKQDDNLSKYEAIAHNLKSLMGTKPFSSFRLSVTGHSLGGALASLLSFLLACDERIWDGQVYKKSSDPFTNIICISFAAPHVGDEGFQKAYEVLKNYRHPKAEIVLNEDNVDITKTPRLKHLRVTTDRDIVPVGIPLVSPTMRQTGLNMHLRPKIWWRFWGSRTSIAPTEETTTFLPFGGKFFPEWLKKLTTWPRLSILGMISTTFPVFWLIFPYSFIHGIILWLPLSYYEGIATKQTWSKFDLALFLLPLSTQVVMLFLRKPLQIGGIGLGWITHSLTEYYKNIVEDKNIMKEMTSDKLFEKYDTRPPKKNTTV